MLCVTADAAPVGLGRYGKNHLYVTFTAAKEKIVAAGRSRTAANSVADIVHLPSDVGRPRRLFQEVKESNDKITEALGKDISYDHDSEEEEEDRCIRRCTQLGYRCNDDDDNDNIESTTSP